MISMTFRKMRQMLLSGDGIFVSDFERKLTEKDRQLSDLLSEKKFGCKAETNFCKFISTCHLNFLARLYKPEEI